MLTGNRKLAYSTPLSYVNKQVTFQEGGIVLQSEIALPRTFLKMKTTESVP